ncbi:hypothetical protein [uncultured Shewanella sp.]|uniref:hypothetical protein n=1 Tax=uncultured Shewanella sp. TaxID=173975 RepID=UPI00260A9DBB|nr:hypothetical protein [uncultured Shewanella sp.]
MTQPINNTHKTSLNALNLAQAKEKEPTSAKKFDPNQVPLSDLGSDWILVPRPVDRTIAALDLAEISDSGKKKLESMDLIKRSTELDQKAKDNGVDLAKKNFFKALFNVALAGVGLGLSIAATVLTGGAGIPVMAMSGVAFALVVSDAGCAFADWRSKAGGGDGLKMGSDALANAVYAMLDKMGMNDENATYWANTTSVVLKTALTVSTLWCSAASAASVPGAVGSALSMIKMGKSTTSSVAGMGLDLGITDTKNKGNKLKTASRNAKQFEADMESNKKLEKAKMESDKKLEKAKMESDKKLEQAQQEIFQLQSQLLKLESSLNIQQLARKHTTTNLNEFERPKHQIHVLV